MATTTLSRPTITDDDGTLAVGTVMDAAFWDAVLDAIDALIANDIEFAGQIKSADTADDAIESAGGVLAAQQIETTDSAEDSIQTAGGVRERGYAASMGVWTAVAHSAGNFTGSGSMTWTVASGDQTTYAYIIIGKTITVSWAIQTSTVGGTPSTALRIAIPASKTATKTMQACHHYIDNAGTPAIGMCKVSASGTVIEIYLANNASNWAASTDNTWTAGQITFEIN